MKDILATCSFTFLLLACFPVAACIPVPPNPQVDAAQADAIFYGTVVAERELPPDPPIIGIAQTIKSSGALKGVAPATLEVVPGCGAHLAQVNESVIVLRRGQYNIVRRAGGQYEQLLLAALRNGR